MYASWTWPFVLAHPDSSKHLDVREADVLEVALGVLHQVGRDGDPQVALATAQPVLCDHAGELPPLAEADAVAEEEAGAAACSQQRREVEGRAARS